MWNFFIVRRAASVFALLIPDELSLVANVSLEFLKPLTGVDSGEMDLWTLLCFCDGFSRFPDRM